VDRGTDRSSKRHWGVLAGGLAAVAAALLVLWPGRAEVAGRTAEQRIASIGLLAERRPAGAADALAAAARDDPDASVRRAALVALGRFVGPKARPAVEAGTQDTDPSVRAAAAGTLGLFADADAADRLKALAADPAEEVRLGAVTGLGRNRHDRAAAILRELIDAGDDLKVRQRALMTILRRYGVHTPTPPVPGTEKWRRLVRMARGPLASGPAQPASRPAGDKADTP